MIAEPAIAPPEARDRTGSAPAPAQVWGLDAIALHDRWWASRRVQVVRRSVAPAAPTGPRLYLLLDRHDLVIFDLDRVTARLAWLGPRAMRLRLTDSEAQAYVERTIGDADGRFVAVRRVYQAASRWTHRAWLTTDPRLARLWAASFGSRDAWRSFLETADREQFASAVCPARVFDAARPREVRECLRLLLDRFATPGEALDGVYEFQPRVWAHESAIIEPGARVVAPAWIGAGVRLRSDAVVIGPDVLADDASVVADPGPIDWDAAHIPGRRAAAGRPRHRRWRRTSKRAFDVAFSLAVLVGTLPLYPLIILAIALEDGWPPFFAHRRQTTRGREFPCYKFRTMCKDAEKMKAQLAARNVCDGPQFFIEDDPRLLRVGRVLRRFQLDELPQFVNVLLGHMSVVGPRPSPDKENQYCPAWREARLSVRPGVTGLWQVRRTRAPETDFQEWIRYDLEYVTHESWRLDVWIILQTIRKIFVK